MNSGLLPAIHATFKYTFRDSEPPPSNQYTLMSTMYAPGTYATVNMSIVRGSKSTRPELLLSGHINAVISITYWCLGSGWGKLLEEVLITDFIENREQCRESFPGL